MQLPALSSAAVGPPNTQVDNLPLTLLGSAIWAFDSLVQQSLPLRIQQFLYDGCSPICSRRCQQTGCAHFQLNRLCQNCPAGAIWAVQV